MRQLLNRIQSEERGDAYVYGGGTILAIALVVLLLIILL
jgi:hypothetical protein